MQEQGDKVIVGVDVRAYTVMFTGGGGGGGGGKCNLTKKESDRIIFVVVDFFLKINVADTVSNIGDFV